MTTVVDALTRAGRQCSVVTPSSWLSASLDEQVELRDDFLRDTVDDMLDRIDFPAPIAAQTTLTAGAGTTNADGSETFAMPAGFNRLQRDDMALYDTLQDRPVVPISTDGRWSNLTDVGASGSIKLYRLEGYEGNWTIDIYRSLGTIIVSYATTYWKATSGGTAGDTFSDSEDVLLLPHRAVEAGIVWRFRERRGLPYQDKYNEYEALLSRAANDLRGRRVINMGEPSKDVKWQDLVPAFIPDS